MGIFNVQVSVIVCNSCGKTHRSEWSLGICPACRVSPEAVKEFQSPVRRTMERFDSEGFATQIREGLSEAFGGYSQFGVEDISRAIKSHHNNGMFRFLSLMELKAILMEALVQEEDRWEALTETEDRAKEWLELQEKEIDGLDSWWIKTHQKSWEASQGVGKKPAIMD